MLHAKNLHRPDRQLQKMLSALVYTVISMALCILMLFIFPEYSLYLLFSTFVLVSIVIGLTIVLISDSEEALTYGGFANVILDDKLIIRRIDNNVGVEIISNKPAREFFEGKNILHELKKKAFHDRSNDLNIERLTQAIQILKEENVLLELSVEGQSRWYQVFVKPIYLKKNDVFESNFSLQKIQKETYFLWIVEDVTAARNMEKIVDQERQKLHHFIEYMPLGIYVLDENKNISYVNETFASQIKVSKERLIGRSIFDFVQKKQEFDPSIFTGLTVFKNDNDENIELFVSQNSFKENDVLQTRGVTLKEVPNDKALLKNLTKIDEEYNLLFYSAPIGILYVAPKGSIISYNEQAVKIFAQDLKGKKLSDILEETLIKNIKEIFLKYQNETNTKIQNFELRLNSGKSIRFDIVPRFVNVASKKHILEGAIFYLRDTTQSKNLELQFAQAQKMQAMGQLAGGVAHDFNNLLTAMIGFCDLLLQRHGIGDPSFADLIQIKQNANRAAALVRQLLAFSRQQALNPKYLDITESLTDLSHLLKRILGEQIKLEFYHGTDLGFIRVDPVQLSQVMMNLVVNAKDAMNGKGVLKIETHTEKILEPYAFGGDMIAPGDFVVISVADTGCGIKKENLSRIFDPFFSTKQNVVGSGTGLGLAMVYGIVRQTEGFIKVESQENIGTTFKIYLPRFEKNENEANTQIDEKIQKTPILTSQISETQKMILGLNVNRIDHQIQPFKNAADVKILFVEDEDSVRTFAVRALKKKGFNVTSAVSAENALEQEGSFDLMITDMVMPGLNGAELAKQIKKRQPDIKIILASGYSEEVAKKELAGSSDFTFIAKPYSLGDLTQKVLEVLNS